MARCFTDYRDPERVEHSLEEMLAQRGYERDRAREKCGLNFLLVPVEG
jgi:hypothetical protein